MNIRILAGISLIWGKMPENVTSAKSEGNLNLVSASAFLCLTQQCPRVFFLSPHFKNRDKIFVQHSLELMNIKT